MIRIIFIIGALLLAIGLVALFFKRYRKFGYGALTALLVGAASLFGFVKVYGLQPLINPGAPTAGASAAQAGVNVTTVAKGLNMPWGMAFLPDGRILVSERDTGLLKLLRKDGSLQRTVPGVPKVVAGGQGGLLEVALHPDFARNKFVYLSFSEGTEQSGSTAVARGRFENDQLKDVKVIFRQAPKVASAAHWGSRLLFVPSGNAQKPWYLFITLGDRFKYRDSAQTLDNHMGKLVRLFDDGSVPADNPFASNAKARPEIYSYGHRNIQGITTAADGAVLTIEHGPKGGDELNAPKAAKNYGWPTITYGEEYTGGPIGKGLKAQAGMEQPLHFWVPSIAPSAMVRLTSDVYPGWKNNIFVSSLAHQQLVRLEMNGLKVIKEHRLLGELGERLRDVKQGPDGKLYLLTDSEEGQLLRLDPK
jgi:aldose sugar dehydrogenase